MDENRKLELRLTLTIVDLDRWDDFKDLPPDKKEKLITLVYELSLALYNIYRKPDG